MDCGALLSTSPYLTALVAVTVGTSPRTGQFNTEKPNSTEITQHHCRINAKTESNLSILA